jgi:hypothetical protein
MTKEEFLQQVSDWYDNSDNHYDDFLTDFDKDKDKLIKILSVAGQHTARLFEPKTKEEWMRDILKPFKSKTL